VVPAGEGELEWFEMQAPIDPSDFSLRNCLIFCSLQLEVGLDSYTPDFLEFGKDRTFIICYDCIPYMFFHPLMLQFQIT